MTDEARYRLDARAVLSEFGDGAVLLDLRTKKYFVLNPTGGTVCRELTAGASLAQVVTALCEAYDVAAPDAERDALGLLRELEGEGLVSKA